MEKKHAAASVSSTVGNLMMTKTLSSDQSKQSASMKFQRSHTLPDDTPVLGPLQTSSRRDRGEVVEEPPSPSKNPQLEASHKWIVQYLSGADEDDFRSRYFRNVEKIEEKKAAVAAAAKVASNNSALKSKVAAAPVRKKPTGGTEEGITAENNPFKGMLGSDQKLGVDGSVKSVNCLDTTVQEGDSVSTGTSIQPVARNSCGFVRLPSAEEAMTEWMERDDEVTRRCFIEQLKMRGILVPKASSQKSSTPLT